MLRSIIDTVRRGSARFTAADPVESRLKKFVAELFVRSKMGHFIAKVLSTDAGQNNFLSFLKVNHIQNIGFLLAVETLKEVAGSDEFIELAKEVINRYLKQPKHEVEVGWVDVKPATRESVFYVMDTPMKGPGDLLAVLDMAEEDVLDHLAADAFDEWIAANPDFAIAEDNPQTQIKTSQAVDASVYAQLAPELNAIRNTWLFHLLQYIDKLPKVAVQLATASRDCYGFPLIHCNKTFEDLTGYERHEWFGKNCRFLQEGQKLGHHAEKEPLVQMTDALRRYKKCRVTLFNFRKDGKAFRHHVCLVPIFKNDGYCAYYLSFSFDMLQHEEFPRKRERVVDDLFEAIPSIWP